jgi:1,4-alpha-glucan branching enzyme
MISFVKEFNILQSLPAKQINMDEANKTIIFERNNLLFLFNWHPDHSIPDYRFSDLGQGNYKIILNTDDLKYGGFGRVDTQLIYKSQLFEGYPKLSVYLPNRMALVLQKVD